MHKLFHPADLQSRLDLGKALYYVNRHEEAIEHFMRILKQHEGHEEAGYFFAMALKKRGKPPSEK